MLTVSLLVARASNHNHVEPFMVSARGHGQYREMHLNFAGIIAVTRAASIVLGTTPTVSLVFGSV